MLAIYLFLHTLLVLYTLSVLPAAGAAVTLEQKRLSVWIWNTKYICIFYPILLYVILNRTDLVSVDNASLFLEAAVKHLALNIF